jgi:hypothetical protein
MEWRDVTRQGVRDVRFVPKADIRVDCYIQKQLQRKMRRFAES